MLEKKIVREIQYHYFIVSKLLHKNVFLNITYLFSVNRIYVKTNYFNFSRRIYGSVFVYNFDAYQTKYNFT